MSNFRKKIVRPPIPGTSTSPQTGQIITSSGNPSLDVILGGGLPIGSICLIEEDKFVTYSKVLAKYFLAEGVLSKQCIFLASLDDSPQELIKKLPQTTDEDETPEATKNGLRIAWRYNDLPMVNSEKTTQKIGHNFNLMEFMDPDILKYSEIFTWPDDQQDDDNVNNHDEDGLNVKEPSNELNNESDATLVMDTSQEIELKNSNTHPTPNSSSMDKKQDMDEKKPDIRHFLRASSTSPTPLEDRVSFHDVKYCRLLIEIDNLLSFSKFHSGSFLVERGLGRVCITSLASPQWYDENFGEDLLKFLTILRTIIRSSISTCFITIPMHLVAKYDETLVPKLRNLVDYSIELESFVGSDKEANPAFKEYNGLLHLRKVSAFNSLSAYMPETTDLAFKLKRKKFVIEKLHLPPELQDDSATTAEQDARPTISCGNNMSANLNTSLDF